jgi:Ca2+-transporting ATPase
MNGQTIQVEGLKNEEVRVLQHQYGRNELKLQKKFGLLQLVWDILKEPMFLLLMLACLLYFILGEAKEGFMMIAAMCFVAAISIYQEFKSSKALQALKTLTEPKVKVVRNNDEQYIPAEELVPGDVMLLTEGEKISADATVIESNDFTVNEGLITGESFPVAKNNFSNELFQGTIVNSGKCKAKITAIGNSTYLAKLGKSIVYGGEIRTDLQRQIGKMVRRLALFGLCAFIVIFIFNFFHTHNVVTSLLFGLTLAMAAIPEEIPVAFSSFMALGAYHMSRLGIIVRRPQTVESLGAVTTICLDKTGTITQNKMQVKFLFDYKGAVLLDLEKDTYDNSEVVYYGLLASEKDPFDEMEKAIWKFYLQGGNPDPSLRMIYEYPLEGQPPMMTHVYEEAGKKIAAAKGAVERIMQVTKMNVQERSAVSLQLKSLASRGFRVIGVASAMYEGDGFPAMQDEFDWKFLGMLAFYDPPREDVIQTLSIFRKAGIKVKLLTGDYLETADNIAKEVGIVSTRSYTGSEIMELPKEEFEKVVMECNVFARMFPEAKLKVIEALKEHHEIVAMTGDGVNDGPAIKAAHIGIAIGKKGTEVARQAADLIITDDDLIKIAEAVEYGRKIFSNLKKAVGYIISIHVPIILTAALPLILGWKYPNIFTPIHVIFLELIMGPTCSIFYEREPAKRDIMLSTPRMRNEVLLDRNEIGISLLQGIIIACGILSLYYFFMQTSSIENTRTVVFTTLVCSNVFLTFTNRSFTETILKTSRYKNNLVLPVLVLSILFLLATLTVPSIQALFGFITIPVLSLMICVVTAFVSVFWFELYKLILDTRRRNLEK